MIYLLNLKTRQAEGFKDAETALVNMRFEPDTYQPLPDREYIIQDRKTGEFSFAYGKNLQRSLGSGKTLVTPENWATTEAVRADNSQLGRFFRSLGSETVLGLDKINDPAVADNPIARKVREKEQELYGTADMLGRITGSVAPFLVSGGIAGVARAGAKKAVSKLAKKSLATTAKGAGVAGWAIPSSAVIKGADKAGKFAKEALKKRGYGKFVQGAGEVAGTGLAFGASAGVLQGIKTGAQELKQQEGDKEFRGSKSTGEIMNSALQEGVRAFGETALSSSLFMGAGMTAFAGVRGVGRLGKTGVTKATGGVSGLIDRMQKASQEKFYGVEPGARGRKVMENLKTWFNRGRPIRTPEDKNNTLKNFEEFLFEKAGLDDIARPIKTKADLLDRIIERADNVSDFMGAKRKFMREFIMEQQYTNVPTTKALIAKMMKDLNDIKNSYSAVERGGLYKTFVKDLDDKIGVLRGELGKPAKDVDPKAINQLMDYFTKQAKFTKRERSELGIDLAYRNVRRKLSQTEDKIYQQVAKNMQKGLVRPVKEGIITYKPLQEVPAIIKSLRESKDLWSKLETSREVIDQALPTGTNFLFGFHTMGTRDGILGIAGGTLGFLAGGFQGSLLGGLAGSLASRAWTTKQMTGWTYLNVTKPIQRIQALNKNVKTPAGIKWFLDKKNKLNEEFKPLWDIKPSTLGTMLLDREIRNFKELKEAVATKPPMDYLSDGNDAMFGTITEYGGDTNASQFMGKTIEMRQDIKGLLLSAGDSKIEQDRTMRLISQFATTPGFIQAVKTKRLTRRGLRLFQKHHPDFFSQFVLNLQVGIDDGSIDRNDVRWLLNMITPQDKRNMVYRIADDVEGQQAQIAPPRKLSLSRPTQSELSAGGGYPQ